MSERLFDENGEPKATALNIQGNLFYYAGQLIIQCILQGGPTPNVLSKGCYKTISASAEKASFLSIEDIPDDFKSQPPIKKVIYSEHYFTVNLLLLKLLFIIYV